MGDERFLDRRDAGRRLAAGLTEYRGRGDVVVLGLPRGGVPVAAEVARALAAPLDVFIVRKLGLPSHPELAMGAIASGGILVLNEEVVELYGVPRSTLDAVAASERQELARREDAYRSGRPPLSLEGRTAILVDDGLATGATMRAAVEAARAARARRVVVAVPVGAPQTCADLLDRADAVVCVAKPDPFQAVGLWYVDFDQTTDEEVVALLDEAEPT